jgi:hypothetical protein
VINGYGTVIGMGIGRGNPNNAKNTYLSAILSTINRTSPGIESGPPPWGAGDKSSEVCYGYPACDNVLPGQRCQASYGVDQWFSNFFGLRRTVKHKNILANFVYKIKNTSILICFKPRIKIEIMDVINLYKLVSSHFKNIVS